MRIDLKKIEISAFRNFGEKQSLEIPQNGVVSITSINKDDGGSNGSGKSSFVMAVVVNLFGPTQSGNSSKALKNRFLDIPTRIVGYYEVNGKDLIVDRTIGGRFTYSYDDSEWKDGKSEDIQLQLNNILNISSEQFRLLTYKAQGVNDSFLLMKDSQKKEFLSSFFDVQFIEKAKELAELEFKKINSSTGIMQYSLDSDTFQLSKLSQELKKIEIEFESSERVFKQEFHDFTEKLTVTQREKEKAIEILQNKDKLSLYVQTSLQQDFEHYRQNKTENESRLSDLENALQDKLDALKTTEIKLMSIPAMPDTLLTEEKQIKNKMLDIRYQLDQITKIDASLKVLELNKKDLQLSLSEHKNLNCPICNTPLKAEDIDVKIKKPILDKIANLDAKINDLLIARGSIVLPENTYESLENSLARVNQAMATFSLENNSESFQKEIMSLNSMISIMKSNLSSITQNLKQDEHTMTFKIESCKKALENTVTALDLGIQNMMMTIQAKSKQINILSEAVAKKTLDIKDIEKTLINTKKYLEEARVNCEIFDHIVKITSKTGFIGYVFDSMLEDLNSEINENIKIIPNAKKFSLQFTSDKIAKTTGNVSKAITYKLYSGFEEIDFSSLSGGEQLSLIIAVDEALDTVIGRRLGVTFGWKFLDEQMYWTDANSKESILEFYRSKSFNKAYFIIDHAAELNAALDNKIVIIKENNIARFA